MQTYWVSLMPGVSRSKGEIKRHAVSEWAAVMTITVIDFPFRAAHNHPRSER
jgi:hypothetical protein